jgi:tetratricopeptide (TPR) repeat protein
LDQFDQALADFDESIRLNPRVAGAYGYRGGVYFARRDYSAAQRDFSEAIKLNSKEPAVHFQLASTLAAKGELRPAIKALDAAIQLNAKYTQAYLNRVIARFRTGDVAGSQADMQKGP